MPRILLSCGEASGDLYAGALTRALIDLDPTVGVSGLGGPELAAAGGSLVADYRGLSVTGLVEALGKLPRWLATLRRLVDAARAERPEVAVAIDSPDFNFWFARAMRRLGIAVVYYVSPQLWAWRPGRMRSMKAFTDLVLVIFPFEEEIYRQAGVPVEFVGHPLVDLAKPNESREVLLGRLGLDPGAPTVALLPGSRSNEVRAILPDLVAAASLVRQRLPSVQFTVARAAGLGDALFDIATRARDARLDVVEGQADAVLAASDAVVTASGTATVQSALHERPMVIVYRLSPLTYLVGKPLVKVDTYGMVNLVAGRRIVPELIQRDFTPQAVADHTLRFLTDPHLAETTRAALREVKARLGGPGASRRAAEAVLRVARTRHGAGENVRA